MKYCPNCGAQLLDGAKFCQECGQKIVVSEPVLPVYEAPVQQGYETPPQSYTSPVQQSDEPAQQSYTPPVQQSDEPAQQSYTPPAQSRGVSYVPSPEPGKAPKAPKEKKPINKKIFLFAGIGVVAILLVVILIACLGGKGHENANLGRYESVSCEFDGLVMPLDNDWVELKAKDKATICMDGTEFNGTWSVDGEQFTLKQRGDTFTGTLKEGVLAIDISGVVYTFAKEGAEPGETEPTAGGTEPSGQPEAAVEAGYWTLLRVDSSSADNAMSEEDVAIFKDLGIEYYVDLREDGTGLFVFDGPASITWANGVITAEDGTTLAYTLADDLLQIEMATEVYVMTRGEGSAPEVGQSDFMGGETEPMGGDADPDDGDWGDWGDLYSDYAWWDGTWYGWYVISNANSAYESNINNAYDVTATIEVYADDTGFVDIVDIDGDDVCWCAVSFGAGITENGCMMSEDGSIFGFDIGHADWIVDPGASMVSEFDYMIQIDGTVVDEDGDWFDYKLFLRPWGMEWEDIRCADTSDMLYDDMMPLYYDDWYVPQLDDSIG